MLIKVKSWLICNNDKFKKNSFLLWDKTMYDHTLRTHTHFS